MILLLGVAHPVRAEQIAYISLSDPSEMTCASATNNPWKLIICPADATNYLPGQPERVLNITLQHNNPVPSCENKEINLTTTLGIFVQSGLPYLVVKTNKTCSFDVSVYSVETGVAVITAKKTEPPGVMVQTQVNWTGTPATPSFTLQVISDPFLITGDDARFDMAVENTGNAPLTELTVTVGTNTALYQGGDDLDTLFEPGETWNYSYSSPVNGTSTFEVRATAFFHSIELNQSSSLSYTGLQVEKTIPISRFREAYHDLPFNVTAHMESSGMDYPFTIQVDHPAEVVVLNTTWEFTEESREVQDPYAGTFSSPDPIHTYQPGDNTPIEFVNELGYLPALVQLDLTEHSVEMNLDAEEFHHTLTAFATDQYGEPLPNLTVTFADRATDSSHTAGSVVTNESGIAEYSYFSEIPHQILIDAFMDGDHDSYFDDQEIGDSCRLSWTYTPTPYLLIVQGDAEATNYLDYNQFEHVFTLTLSDQHGFPMNNTRVDYFIDSENGTDATAFAITGEDGNVSLSVTSHVPDVAHITAGAGTAAASMNKTWVYEVPPTTLTFNKTARDVNGGMLVVGDTIEYILNVNNIGPNPALFVNVTDDLPEGVTCRDVEGDPSACSDPYLWDIGVIDPETGISRSLNVTIHTDAAGTSIINMGTISGRNFPPVPPPQVCVDGSQPEGDLCEITPVPRTSLALEKSAIDVNGGVLETGDLVTYTLTVTNTGLARAFDVVVTDDLPEYLTCRDVEGDPSACSDPYLWSIGTLESGSSMSRTITTSIDSDATGQSILNTGRVSGGNVDPVDPAQVCPDGSAPVEGICLTAPVPPQAPSANLTFTKEAEDVNGGLVVTGDIIQYTFTVTNTDSTPAYNVMVTDTLPALLSCLDVAGDPAGCGATILWYIGQMEPGENAHLTLNATLLTGAEGKSIVNIGLVSGQNVNSVDPSQVCPDGTPPVEGICPPVVPEIPAGEPSAEDLIHTSSSRGSSGSYAIIPPISVVISVSCGEEEHYLKGVGCIHCGENETFVQDIGCVKNETPLLIGEPPVQSANPILGVLIGFVTNPLLLLALLVLLAALAAYLWWWRQKELPGPQGEGGIAGVAAAEAAFASIIRVINNIDGQLAALERGLRTQGPLSSLEAARVAESFFYTSQIAEGVLKDPEIRQYLSAQQVAHLQTQLELSVQKMHFLSRQYEPLLNAVQMQYVQAQV